MPTFTHLATLFFLNDTVTKLLWEYFCYQKESGKHALISDKEESNSLYLAECALQCFKTKQKKEGGKTVEG